MLRLIFPQQVAEYLFFLAETVDEGDVFAARLEGIVPQPFQPYKKSDARGSMLTVLTKIQISPGD